MRSSVLILGIIAMAMALACALMGCPSGEPDTTPPTVVSLSPAEASTTDAASITKLVITFSEAMRGGYYFGRTELTFPKT